MELSVGATGGLSQAKANAQYAPKSALWTAATLYVAGQLVHNAGTLYRVTADHTSPASFTTANLTALGGGGGTSVVIEEDDVTVVTTVDHLDFGNGLDVTQSPSGEANVVLDLTEYTGGALPIASGGTGATSAAAAVAALGIPSSLVNALIFGG
jgi:hypothetical protein